MRDQVVQVEVPAGVLEVIGTGVALDMLREGTGISLMVRASLLPS